MAEIEKRIQDSDAGSIFLTADFSDISSVTTTRKCLGRLVKSGTIDRVMDGVYEKPRYSGFLNEKLPVDPEAVAYSLAEHYHWSIAPSGDVALNKLGLSTQVPIVWSYISDGPYREYSFGGITVSFRHRTNRDISRMSADTAMVIEALKTLGKNRIDDETLAVLRARLSKEERTRVLREAANSAEWIYAVLRKVCEE